MNDQIKSNYIEIQNTQIFYLETENNQEFPVLLLHGASFSSQTWLDLGTLNILAANNCYGVAIDLPGYGKSRQVSISNKSAFILELLAKLNLTKPLIISPSMSGVYSLPFLAEYSYKLSGFVALAPVGIANFIHQLEGLNIPTLAIWGSQDKVVSVSQADLLLKALPNARKVILENAGHPCYLKSPEAFHQHLLKFINQLINQDFQADK